MMENIKIIVIDEDDDFKSRFLKYIVNSCSNVSAFTSNSENFINMSEIEIQNKLQLYDVLIIGKNIIDRRHDNCFLDSILSIVLTENDEPYLSQIDNKNDDWKTPLYLYKYQNASNILKPIIDKSYRNQIKIKRCREPEDLSIITITSSTGGAGKTALGLTFARLNRQLNHRKPLIIDMRTVSDYYCYFPAVNEKEYDDINFLLVNMDNTIENPERYVVQDKYGISKFVTPENHKSDITELNQSGIEQLLNQIKNWDMFDTVIFEMSSCLNESALYLYEISDHIFSLQDERSNKVQMAELWEMMIGKYSSNRKIISLTNFHNIANQKQEIFIDENNIEEEQAVKNFILPYDPDSFFRNNGTSDISMTGKYSAAVTKMMKEVVKF